MLVGTSTTAIAWNKPLIFDDFAFKTAATNGFVENLGAIKIPGTSRKRGNTVFTSSKPVYEPSKPTPPTTSAA